MAQSKIPLLKEVIAEADTLRAAVYDAEMVEDESARMHEEITVMVKASGLAQLLAGAAQTVEAIPAANADVVAEALARAHAARGQVVEAVYLAAGRAADGGQFGAAARVFAALKAVAGGYRNSEALRVFALAMQDTQNLAGNGAMPAARQAAAKACSAAPSPAKQKQARELQRSLYLPPAAKLKEQGAFMEAIKTLDEWLKLIGEDSEAAQLRAECQQAHFEALRSQMAAQVARLIESGQFDAARGQLRQWMSGNANDDVTVRLSQEIENAERAEYLAQRAKVFENVAQARERGDFATAIKTLQEWLKTRSDDEAKRALEEVARATNVIILFLGMTKLELMKIPAGKFLYGDNKTQSQTGEYWIGKAPVTEAQFAAFAKATGHHGDSNTSQCIAQGRDHPMTQVNCVDAEAFCRWLSEMSGLGIRLPTEQEWEKAARGVDGRTYPWGEKAPSSRLCNISGTAPGATTSVGSYPAGNSPYGCEDMAGNVWEWTSSVDGQYRVLRGGSWNNNADLARCAYRGGNSPDSRGGDYGFRVCASPI